MTKKTAKLKAAAQEPEAIAPAPKDEPEACATCRNWHQGHCKRFPPSKVEGHEFAVHRITTAPTDWCGEYRA